jgi:hypothetical protein
VPKEGEPLIERAFVLGCADDRPSLAQPVPMSSMARRAAITASPYSPSFTLRMASRRCSPTLAAALASNDPGTTSDIDIVTAVEVITRCQDQKVALERLNGPPIGTRLGKGVGSYMTTSASIFMRIPRPARNFSTFASWSSLSGRTMCW